MRRKRSPYQAPSKENQKANKQGEPSADQSNSAIARAVSGLKDTLAEKADTNREESRREDRGSKLIEIATLVFVILTTVGIFYQAHILSSSDEAIHKSATAAKDAADAAKSAVELSDRTAERQLRAYLILDQAEITRFMAGQTIEFHGVVKNTGQTPAYDIDGYTAIMYDAFPLPYPFPEVSAASIQETQSVLGRDQVVHARLPTKPAPTQETIDAINAGTMAVYVFGRVTYRDAFGVNRYTNYRLVYNKPSEGAGLLRPLGKVGNDAN